MKEKDNWLDYAQIGLELSSAVLLGFFGGWWLDRRFGTLPWLTLAGAAAGIAGGFLLVARELFKVKDPPPGGKQ